MPTRRFSAHLWNLRVSFLHAILSQVLPARRDGFANNLGRMRLAHRYQRDLVRLAIATDRGLCHSISHVLQALLKIFSTLHHWTHFRSEIEGQL